MFQNQGLFFFCIRRFIHFICQILIIQEISYIKMFIFNATMIPSFFLLPILMLCETAKSNFLPIFDGGSCMNKSQFWEKPRLPRFNILSQEKCKSNTFPRMHRMVDFLATTSTVQFLFCWILRWNPLPILMLILQYLSVILSISF